MNQFAGILIWCGLQVTIVSLVAGVCILAIRRGAPATRAFVASTGLCIIVVLSLLSFSSWPNYRSFLVAESSTDNPKTVIIDTDVPSSEKTETNKAVAEDGLLQEADDEVSSSFVSDFAGAFWSEMQKVEAPVAAEEKRSDYSWTHWLTILFAVGIGLAAIRLVAGYVSSIFFRHASQPIDETSLGELLDVLRAELGVKKAVGLVESKRLTTAATLGWWKPVILLPPEWNDWDEDRRRVVLAHELAHIKRRDYLNWIFAQLGVMLHFYHPLVHWLAAELRMNQELAADSTAARLSGGQQSYLETLAELALQQPDRTLSWPAQTFLPTRRTFLRRIEMLRDSKLSATSASTGMKATMIALVMTAGVFAAGLRGSNIESQIAPTKQVVGEEEPATEQVVPSKPKTDSILPIDRPVNERDYNQPLGKSIELAYVPRDAMAVVAIRPAQIFKKPIARPIVEALKKDDFFTESMGVPVSSLEQVLFVALSIDDRMNEPFHGVVLNFSDADAAAAYIKKQLPKPTRQTYGNYTYLRGSKRRNGEATSIYQPEDHVVVVGMNEQSLRRFIVAGKQGPARASWVAKLKKFGQMDIACMLDTTKVRQILDRELQTSESPAVASIAPYVPLWQKTSTFTAGFQFDKSIQVDGTVYCSSEGNAIDVKETISALIVIGRNMLSHWRQVASKDGSNEGLMMLQAADIADDFWHDMKVNQNGQIVTLSSQVNEELSTKLVGSFVPAIIAARRAAQRAQSMNNLKQLALAMHNYHAAYNKFPPAKVVGPDGKTVHSWRVALLPYMEEEELYKQYRLNEPWDSPHNKTLIEQMPAVFRHASEPSTSTNASYFGLVGPGTLFESKEGTPIHKVIDGTSNTIMFVEAKRDIPWTKPDDITFDPKKDPPKLGGYSDKVFNVALTDGSVFALTPSVDKKLLKNLIQINDRDPLTLDKIRIPSGRGNVGPPTEGGTAPTAR